MNKPNSHFVAYAVRAVLLAVALATAGTTSAYAIRIGDYRVFGSCVLIFLCVLVAMWINHRHDWKA